MDLLEEIRNKSAALVGHSSLESINAVIRHVEVAERYLTRAREERDDDLFNDVIYRTNQAFEGMLKEAYTVLTDKDGARLSPHQIEQHLLQANVLGRRVLELFTNYRTQWRNPSTHNHTLFFTDQEALLAIVSVSAFTNILLNQVIETVNYKQEQEEIKSKKDQLNSLHMKGTPLHEELIAILISFSEHLFHYIADPRDLSEIEINGRLHAFIEAADPDCNIVREAAIGTQKIVHADFLFQKNNQEVVMEVKRAGRIAQGSGSGISQVLSYLNTGKWQHGILYVPPAAGERVKGFKVERFLNDRTVTVHIVAPMVEG